MRKYISITIYVLLGVVFLFILFLDVVHKKDDPNIVTVWHWMTDRDNTLQKLAKKYEDETGIKVQIDLFTPPETYKQRIIASTQANRLPDIFGVLENKEAFADYIRYGYIADLSSEFKKDNFAWESALFQKAVDVNRFAEDNIYDIDPGIYGVPIDVTNIQMLYNKKLLTKAGIKNPPETFDQFLKAIAALKRVGVSGFVSGWGELWMINAFASNYAFNIMGEEKIMATYRGEVPYTDPDWVKVFTIFSQLRDAGALTKGIVTKPNKEAEQDFALERVAFAYNGSWCVNVYEQMNPRLEYSAMLPPAVSSKFPMKIWGGAGSSFVVGNQSIKKAKAIAFLKWLTEPEQQAILAKETRNLPSNRYALDSISEVLADFSEGMESTTHPTIWKHNELLNVTDRFNRGIQSILIGEKTPEEVAADVQQVKVHEMKKKIQQMKP